MKHFLLTLMLLWLAALVLPASAADTVYYYYTNTLHSAAAITDAHGNVVERTYYAPYGRVLNRPMRDGPGYTGHEEDPATGLVYMQQRYYDAQSGRFLSVDPVLPMGDGANFNRYWYASDNPYRYTDPFGEQSVGEMIDSAAEGCGAVSCAGWAILSATWQVLGAESVSQVADKGSAASTADQVMAVVSVVTLGKGEEAEDIGKAIYKGSTLARNMAKAGRGVAKGEEHAHHIVARAAKAAAPARAILAKHGIDIDSAVNGAAMSKAAHSAVHTKAYYQQINQRIQAADQAGGRAAVEHELQQTCRQLTNGGC
jgi:RHS repeat-associated protein